MASGKAADEHDRELEQGPKAASETDRRRRQVAGRRRRFGNGSVAALGAGTSVVRDSRETNGLVHALVLEERANGSNSEMDRQRLLGRGRRRLGSGSVALHTAGTEAVAWTLVEMGARSSRHPGSPGHSRRLDTRLRLDTGTAKSEERVCLLLHSSPDLLVVRQSPRSRVNCGPTRQFPASDLHVSVVASASWTQNL